MNNNSVTLKIQFLIAAGFQANDDGLAVVCKDSTPAGCSSHEAHSGFSPQGSFTTGNLHWL